MPNYQRLNSDVSRMVAASVSGTRGGAYAEAYCLQPNGYVTLPTVSSYGGAPSVNPIKELIFSEALANVNNSYYYYGDYGGGDEGCTKIDASARTKAGKFFSRTSQICLDGFDSALICIVSSTGGYTFECPDTSILAVSTMEPSDIFDDRISVTPKEDFDLWGKKPSAVKLNISGCIGTYTSFQQFLENQCGQLRYNFFHAPGSTMGLGYFDSEPCGNFDLTELRCELGKSYPLSLSLNYCNLVGSMPPSSMSPSTVPTVFPSSDDKSDNSSPSNSLPRSGANLSMLTLLVVFLSYVFFGV